jgi:hypothetical protein
MGVMKTKRTFYFRGGATEGQGHQWAGQPVSGLPTIRECQRVSSAMPTTPSLGMS